MTDFQHVAGLDISDAAGTDTALYQRAEATTMYKCPIRIGLLYQIFTPILDEEKHLDPTNIEESPCI
jgi:hypothetical protein